MIELICPKCGERVQFNDYSNILTYNSLICPNCNKRHNFWCKENREKINYSIFNYYDTFGLDLFEEYKMDVNIDYEPNYAKYLNIAGDDKNIEV